MRILSKARQCGQTYGMLALFAASFLALAACGLTPTETASVTTAATTLATVAASKNSTAAALVSDGALFCGAAVSPAGVLIGDGIVAIADASGVPVSVTGAVQSDVTASCKSVGLVAGALPSGTNPTTVPVKTVPTTTLPAIAAATVPATAPASTAAAG